jgi:hypothetical protein
VPGQDRQEHSGAEEGRGRWSWPPVAGAAWRDRTGPRRSVAVARSGSGRGRRRSWRPRSCPDRRYGLVEQGAAQATSQLEEPGVVVGGQSRPAPINATIQRPPSIGTRAPVRAFPGHVLLLQQRHRVGAVGGRCPSGVTVRRRPVPRLPTPRPPLLDAQLHDPSGSHRPHLPVTAPSTVSAKDSELSGNWHHPKGAKSGPAPFHPVGVMICGARH